METIRQPYFLGVDLNDRYAMISFYERNKKEPETASMTAGSEIYQIPLVIGKKKNIGQWYIGDDARKKAKLSEVVCVESLWKRAKTGGQIEIDGEVYEAEALFLLFMKKLLQLPQMLGFSMHCDRLAVTLEHPDGHSMDILWRMAAGLGLGKEQFMVIDHKESFYYFALNQKPELWMRDVCLFEYDNGLLRACSLSRNPKTKPQVITITEECENKMTGDRDLEFLEVLKKTFLNRTVSAAYLVGDGFDGQWMKESLAFLCRGRRAFLGKNLFSKGACYAASVREKEDQWPFLYMGENEMKFNLCIKVNRHGKPEFYDLVTAGRSWFEMVGECEVILSGSNEIHFWKQLPNSREAQIETLELSDFPKRPDRTTRLRITAKPVSDEAVLLEIRDLGFGEIFKATDQVWKYQMSM